MLYSLISDTLIEKNAICSFLYTFLNYKRARTHARTHSWIELICHTQHIILMIKYNGRLKG